MIGIDKDLHRILVAPVCNLSILSSIPLFFRNTVHLNILMISYVIVRTLIVLCILGNNIPCFVVVKIPSTIRYQSNQLAG